MALSEEEIRKITLKAIAELGDKATPELVKAVVNQVVNKGEILPELGNVPQTTGKVILTSFGMNHPGIIAGVTQVLSEAKCDIEDLSQKLMGDFYTMIMILDITNTSEDLADLQNKLNEVAEKLKIKIYLQHEDLFRYMHRV